MREEAGCETSADAAVVSVSIKSQATFDVRKRDGEAKMLRPLLRGFVELAFAPNDVQSRVLPQSVPLARRKFTKFTASLKFSERIRNLSFARLGFAKQSSEVNSCHVPSRDLDLPCCRRAFRAVVAPSFIFALIAFAVCIGPRGFQQSTLFPRILPVSQSTQIDRPTPIVVRGVDPMPIPHECALDIRAVKDKLKISGPTSPSDVAHLLRLHATGRHQSPEVAILCEWLLNDETCRDARLPRQAILIKTDAGIAYARLQTGVTRDAPPLVAGEAHSAQILSALAEAGVSSRKEMRVGGLTYHVSDLIDETASSFRFDDDMEWRSVALALYRPQIGSWHSRYDGEVSWEAITRELLFRVRSVEIDGGSCFGTHALYTLAILFRVDGEVQIWKRDEMRREVEDTFALAIRRLSATQLPDGSWCEAWRLPEFPPQHLHTSSVRRLLITGHQLEWLALLPSWLRPNAQVLSSATRFATALPASMSVEDNNRWICPCSHGIRACLLFEFGDSE